MEFDEQLLNHLKRVENDEVQAILKRKPYLLKLVDSDGSTLLHYAAKYCNFDMAEYLINSGVDVNVQDRRGRTALMIAALLSDGDGVPDLNHILLEANAYVHLRDVNGESALQMIFKSNLQFSHVGKLCVRNLTAHYSNDNDELAKLFLECKSALHRLVWAEDPTLTRSVLQQGYPVDTSLNVDDVRDGCTALHEAVSRNDFEHVMILVEYGADVNATNKYGWTPCRYFSETHVGSLEMLKILKTLLDRGAWTTTIVNGYIPIEKLLIYGGRKEIQMLLQHNLNFRAKDIWQQTALHFLAVNKCENILEELQGMDFDVNIRDRSGCTPLHYAIGNSSSVNFLLKNGADANASDDHGITALHRCFSLDNGYAYYIIDITCDIRAVELLLEYGADPQAWDRHGTTVIFVAADNNEFIRVKPVLAHLAMLQARGVVIKKRIKRQIYEDDRLKKSFNFYAKKLKQMKTVKIWKSVTLYDLLMELEDKLAVYMRDRGFVLKLARISKKYIAQSNYYFDLIQRRVEKVLRNTQVERRASVVICKLMKLHYNAFHIISDNVVNYLSYNDLLTLVLLQDI